MPFKAPDGSNKPINNSTVQSFRIPAHSITLLWGWANAQWEQAVVIGIDGVRHPEQLGTFRRPTFISIGAASRSRMLTLAGWHKRSVPSSSQPWHASRGRTINDVASWDDSGGDNDFNDFLVRVGFVKPVIKFSFLPVKSAIVKAEVKKS